MMTHIALVTSHSHCWFMAVNKLDQMPVLLFQQRKKDGGFVGYAKK